MEAIGETSLPDDSGSHSLCPDPHVGAAAGPGWAHLHKPIIVMVMGCLMSAAGGLLFLLQSLGGTRSVASACLSLGLMFVVMGLVWIPILKEKQRRKRCTSGKDWFCFGGPPAAMSTSVQVEPFVERRYGGVGRCKCSFWFAVAHDVVGVFIMMVGVFGGLVIHDLFIYAGAIIIFLSLIWWVFWYSGNIDVPPGELEDDVGLIKLKNSGLSRVVRRVSDRFSSRIWNSFRKDERSTREDQEGSSRPSNPGTEVSLSTIYDSTIAFSSKELVRETLSI